MEYRHASEMNGKRVTKLSLCNESKHSEMCREERKSRGAGDGVEKAFSTILGALGENTGREGLLHTPSRAAECSSSPRAARRQLKVSTDGI